MFVSFSGGAHLEVGIFRFFFRLLRLIYIAHVVIFRPNDPLNVSYEFSAQADPSLFISVYFLDTTNGVEPLFAKRLNAN